MRLSSLPVLLLGLAACGADPASLPGDPDALQPAAHAAEGPTQAARLLGSPMHAARSAHAAVALPDGRVLASGGASDGGGLTSAELFDPATSAWTATPPMSSGHARHTATLLTDGRVLVVGGLGAISAVAVDVFTPKTGLWTQGPPLSTPRAEHSATLLAGGLVLVAGGSDGKVALWSSLLFHPQEKQWLEGPSLNVPRRSHTDTLLPGGSVLLVGGASPLDAPDISPPEKGIAERFDPAQNSWTLTAPGLAFRSRHTATLLADGRVLVAGGIDAAAVNVGSIIPLASADLYDPIADTWVAAAPMNAPHSAHTATLLPSGRVLVVGGDPAPRVTELYDPLSNSWSLGGLLAHGRAHHSATLLADATVLIAGGLGDEGPLSSAEQLRGGVLGEPCQSPWECASGYCADGVCCDTGCGGDVVGACRACSAARGASADGTCTTIAACGEEALPPPAVTFGVQVCHGDADCGAAGHCVDGVCCDSACADQCFSCILASAPGHCARQPAGFDLRHDCGPIASCESTCGESGQCVIADAGTQCLPSECADDGIHGLGPALCPAQGAACPTERVPFSCAPFRCVAAFGQCATACLTVDDCASPYVCDPTQRCVAPPDIASGSECAAVPGSAHGLGAWAALLALLGGAMLRRHRSRALAAPR
jgi:hypothetical protein